MIAVLSAPYPEVPYVGANRLIAVVFGGKDIAIRARAAVPTNVGRACLGVATIRDIRVTVITAIAGLLFVNVGTSSRIFSLTWVTRLPV